MNLRKKISIVAIISIITFQLLQIIDLNIYFDVSNAIANLILLGIFSLIVFLGLAWIIGPRVKRTSFVPLLLFPSWIAFSIAAVLEYGFLEDVSRVKDRTIGVFFLILLGVGLYVLFLTMNILSVSQNKSIPLNKAAQAAHYIFTLLGIYFTTLLMSNFQIHLYYKVPIFLLLMFFLMYCSIWNLKLKIRANLILALGIGLVISVLYIALSLWPIPSTFLALVITLFAYMFLGLALEQKEYIGKFIWFEYLFLIIIITLVILRSSIWGINGSFLRG